MPDCEILQPFVEEEKEVITICYQGMHEIYARFFDVHFQMLKLYVKKQKIYIVTFVKM